MLIELRRGDGYRHARAETLAPASIAVSSAAERGLLILRVVIGVFLIVKSTSKFGWLLDSSPLEARLTNWAAREDVVEFSRSYAQALLPGAALFARLSLIGELGGGVALVAGFRTRVIAILAALMILNFHLATGGLIAMDFISDPSGLVVIGALIALAIGAERRTSP